MDSTVLLGDPRPNVTPASMPISGDGFAMLAPRDRCAVADALRASRDNTTSEDMRRMQNDPVGCSTG